MIRARSIASLFAIAGAALTLAGCAGTDTARIGQLLVQSLSGQRARTIRRDQAAAIPYATLGISFPDTNEGVLVLGERKGHDSDWFNGGTVFVRTRNGRVVRTAGLPHDLGGLRIRSGDPTKGGAFTLVLDYPDLGLFGAPAACTAHDLGPDNVTILGARIAVRHRREHCRVPLLHWSFDDDFWTDPKTGMVWRSVQYLNPKMDPVTLEVLRPETPAD